MLALLLAGATPDYDAWRRWMAHKAKEKRATLPPVDPTRLIAIGESEPNGSQATADFITGFGTGAGDDPAADVTGAISTGSVPTVIGPFAEDEGSIPLASSTALVSGAAVKVSQFLGDGPHGSGGSGNGDFDFFAITGVAAGDTITAEIDAQVLGSPLDSFVVVWDAAGTSVASNDDYSGLDSFVSYTATAPGTYYVSVGAYLSFAPADPFDSSSGPGSASEGAYDVTIGLNAQDADFFGIALEPGDVIAGGVVGGAAELRLFDPSGVQRIGSGQDIGSIIPGPFPTGNAAFAYVVEVAGTYAVRVGNGGGAYTLELRVFRPYLEGQAAGAVQTLFIDFDGATIDPAIFGNPPGSAALSPLSSFLAGWGLAPANQNAVIDAILAAVEESLSTDMRVLGANGDFDVTGTPGDFDVVLLNSRDHADPFGNPNVSRVIVGGTISQLGISTIGIAQSIDVGNFATGETAVVLLDLLSAPASDPNSLNQYPLGGGATIIDLIGVGVGNITAHEAGHFFANFHTDNANAVPNIMDQGGNLANTVGVGTDLIFGTLDDVDVDFGAQTYAPNEGFTGLEDTLNAVAFDLSTSDGAGLCALAPLTGCRQPTASAAARLTLKDSPAPHAKDSLSWKWSKGEATGKADFGNPTTGTDYVLCLYDTLGGTPALKLTAQIPGGGTCAGKPCWKENSKGFKYSDKELTPDGIQKVSLKEGLAGEAAISVKGKGGALDLPASAYTQDPKVIVQLVNGNGECWDAEYSAPATKNVAGNFTDRGD